MKPPRPIIRSTTSCTATLSCDFRGKRDDEDVFVIVCNNVTKQEIYREKFVQKVYVKKVEIADLSPDTLYTAHVLARNATFTELTSISGSVLFITTGML